LIFTLLQGQNRIYLVLEYCAGGDLAAYIQRYGKVTDLVARHFMRQLGMYFVRVVVIFADNSLELWSETLVEPSVGFVSGAGLQVLRNNNLIHRDLKPQVGRNFFF
jgi:serine/threonine-protein kinase ULK/ATG1